MESYQGPLATAGAACPKLGIPRVNSSSEDIVISVNGLRNLLAAGRPFTSRGREGILTASVWGTLVLTCTTARRLVKISTSGEFRSGVE